MIINRNTIERMINQMILNLDAQIKIKTIFRVEPKNTLQDIARGQINRKNFSWIGDIDWTGNYIYKKWN